MTKPEVTYYIRRIAPDCIQVSKMVDGDDEPQQVYRIVNNQCQCWQAVTRKKECRHLVMMREFIKLGEKPLECNYEQGSYKPLGGIDEIA